MMISAVVEHPSGGQIETLCENYCVEERVAGIDA